MDSCVTAAIAREENRELAFLHVSYGQRTEARERRAFEEVADFYKVSRRLVVSLEHLARIGGSSLTDPSIPVAEADLASREIPTSYVPFRNAHLLSAATSWAEVIGARRVYIGAVAEDSSGYPDCRPEFYEAFQRVVDVGTRPTTRVDIRTPVIRMRKSEIVRRGVELLLHAFAQLPGHDPANAIMHCDEPLPGALQVACSGERDPLLNQRLLRRLAGDGIAHGARQGLAFHLPFDQALWPRRVRRKHLELDARRTGVDDKDRTHRGQAFGRAALLRRASA